MRGFQAPQPAVAKQALGFATSPKGKRSLKGSRFLAASFAKRGHSPRYAEEAAKNESLSAPPPRAFFSKGASLKPDTFSLCFIFTCIFPLFYKVKSQKAPMCSLAFYFVLFFTFGLWFCRRPKVKNKTKEKSRKR